MDEFKTISTSLDWEEAKDQLKDLAIKYSVDQKQFVAFINATGVIIRMLSKFEIEERRTGKRSVQHQELLDEIGERMKTMHQEIIMQALG